MSGSRAIGTGLRPGFFLFPGDESVSDVLDSAEEFDDFVFVHGGVFEPLCEGVCDIIEDIQEADERVVHAWMIRRPGCRLLSV